MLEINYFFGRKGLGGSDAYYEILNEEIDKWLLNTLSDPEWRSLHQAEGKHQAKMKKRKSIQPFAYDLEEADLKRERQKARELRGSQWWKRRVAKGECHYCGRSTPSRELTMDHIVPVSRGGKSTKGNVVPCCKACNTAKKQLLPIEWEEYLKTARTQASDLKWQKQMVVITLATLDLTGLIGEWKPRCQLGHHWLLSPQVKF